MDNAEIKVSDSELQLLRLLWDEAPLTATELAERVGNDRNWSITTVKTMLSRLVAKGAIFAEADGRRFNYRPALERATIAAFQADRLVDRLFGGRISPLVAQLAEQRDLDPADVEELEQLIRKLKK